MAVPGLTLHESWLPREEEAALLAAIDGGPWRDDLQRRVQHHGWAYDYKARRVRQEMHLGPLPGWAAAIVTRIANEGVAEERPDQVTVNEYLPSQGISRHVDCLSCFGPTVLSLSLGSTCVMDLTLETEAVSIVLPPRSLLVLAGESRTRWAHAISGRRSDRIDGARVARGRRVSLTFRTVRAGRP